MTGFTAPDYIVLIGYFVFTILFGLWMARRTRTSDGYFLGERKFRWWIMIGQSFGTGTSAEMPVAQAGAVFQYGFSSIWFQWKNMLITPFYWLIAPWYRRSRCTTLGEMVEERFGRGLAVFYSAVAILFFVFGQGVLLQGAAKIISVATGGKVSASAVVIGMTVAFLLYGFFGGLVASAFTDFLQSFMIIVLSLLLIPLGLNAVGGFAGMRQSLPPDFFTLYSEVSGIGGFMILMLALNGIVGITAQPHMISMCATGDSERSGRIGMTYGSLVKRLCTIGWALTGLIVAAMVVCRGEILPDPEMAFGYACRELLGPGLIGLMVASVTAANMSTCSNLMVNSGALFTRNFYRPFLDPSAPDRRLLLVGRISSFGLTLLGVLFALSIKNVLQAFLFTETIPTFLGLVILGGILWRRANRQGALAAILVSVGVYYFLNFRDTGELLLVYDWKPHPFGWSMFLGALALVIVSLLTRPEEPRKVEAYFDNLERLSDAAPADGPAPRASEHGKDLLFYDLPGWFGRGRWRGFWKRYREDLLGFLIAWGVVGLIVLLAYGIMQIGR